MTAPDIRDIRGPVPIPPAWLLPLEIAAACALAGAIAWLVVRARQRRGAPIAAALTPEDVALERLDAARRLMLPGRAREFGGAVSDAIRGYVEQRFGLRAPNRTTEEFLTELVRGADPTVAAQRAPLADFLGHCDLVKFARLPLGGDEMEALLGSARRFVEASRPAPSPPDTDATLAAGAGAPRD